MPRTFLTAVLISTLMASAAATAGEITAKTELRPFNVAIRVFDPTKGLASGQDYVLPVDSPDAEHAVASTMANAVSFSTKTDAGKPLPVAFTCLGVEADGAATVVADRPPTRASDVATLPFRFIMLVIGPPTAIISI